jgi:alginate O-acetyltransferase complex protein AlgI
LKAAIFFQLVCFGWLLFRCDSLVACFDFGARVLSSPFDQLSAPSLSALTWASLMLLATCDLCEYRVDDPRWYERLPLAVRTLLYASLAVLALGGLLNRSNTFIYFQF